MSRASRKFHSGNLITLNYCSGLWLMLLAESMLVSRTCLVTHLNSSYCGVAIIETNKSWCSKIASESFNCGSGEGARVERDRLSLWKPFPSPSYIKVAVGRKTKLPLQSLC